jgi:non-ribosomal peptide synthetase component F
VLLREIGPGEHPVALLLEHNISAVVALLAVLKAGRPYTALHPAHPVQHVTAILADAQPACLIGSRALQAWLEGLPAADPQLRVL